jgi:hypothetical protein
MDKLMNKRTWSLVAVTSVLAAGAGAALAGKTVIFRGATVSSEVSVINGRAYVPLADMARALGGNVVARAGGYEIVTHAAGADGDGKTAPGGANEVRGQNGNVGDMLFNGYWRFQVKSVERTAEYTYRFRPRSGTIKPNGDNDELVVATCLIKNGHKVAEQPILATNGTNAQKTALADDQGQSYSPLDFDVRDGQLLPGAGKTFAVLFSVPKGTQLKSLVFTLYGYGETSTKATNVRVAVGP